MENLAYENENSPWSLWHDILNYYHFVSNWQISNKFQEEAAKELKEKQKKELEKLKNIDLSE